MATSISADFTSFPKRFTIPHVGSLLEQRISHMVNPHLSVARNDVYEWYTRFTINPSSKKRATFLKRGQFDVLAALSFPYATEFQLGACLMFYLWAFAVDDIADEGKCQQDTEAFARLTKLSIEVLNKPSPNLGVSVDPYVEMLQDLLARLRVSGKDGMLRRFSQGVEDWLLSQKSQSTQRSDGTLPTVENYLTERRNTFGIGMACALVEYTTMDVDLPDIIFKDATIIEMTGALYDVTIWANDLCSFNKEQAQGDYHNLVPILMQESSLDLQSAIDKLTEMVRQKLDRYFDLKSQIKNSPVEGGLGLKELFRYLNGLELSSVGIMKWYYQSPRYFGDVDASNGLFVEIELFERQSETAPRSNVEDR